MYLGVKNQILLAKSLDLGCIGIADAHIKIDKYLLSVF